MSSNSEGSRRRSARAVVHAWTLRRRVGRSFVALLVLLIVLFGVLLASLLDFRNRADEVINRWEPASATSQNLLSDLVNQEAGVRGYALGRRADFLQPYTSYRRRQRADQARLSRLVSGDGELEAELAAVVAAARHWQATVARPFIARVRQGDKTVGQDVADARAKAAFDVVRRASARLAGGISRARRRAESQRSVAGDFVAATFAGSFVLTLAAGLLVWRGLRSSVLIPVERLAGQARQVADGDVRRRIVSAGPPEIAALGGDVERMRARIADELERIEQARVALEARTEELGRSNADLEQFAYVASHDLSEPLRKVANFCQLLERQYADQLDDKAKQYISFATDGAKRMQALISDLLAFSRVGRTTEEFVPIDLDHALDRALANLGDRIESAGATVVRSTALPTVPGDLSLLTALFQNLVGNAVKYRGEDPPVVEIGATREEDRWRITVSDNGLGIDPQYAERIFAIFQRLHLRDQYGGTGIGLALCRKIVEFHGGRIDLVPSSPPGATFAVLLPGDTAGMNAMSADER